VVKSEGGNKDEVVVDVPIEQHDINAVYAAELKVLGTKAPKEVHIVSDDQKQEDYYKNFRTNVGVTPASRETTDKQVLLAWTMSNGVLAVVILWVCNAFFQKRALLTAGKRQEETARWRRHIWVSCYSKQWCLACDIDADASARSLVLLVS